MRIREVEELRRQHVVRVPSRRTYHRRLTIWTVRVSRVAGVGRLKKMVKDATGVQSGSHTPAHEEELSSKQCETAHQWQW